MDAILRKCIFRLASRGEFMFRFVAIDLFLQFLIYVGEVLSALRISYFTTERRLLL
jgi:hypothetical protein